MEGSWVNNFSKGFHIALLMGELRVCLENEIKQSPVTIL
jgi:hypothetical protein